MRNLHYFLMGTFVLGALGALSPLAGTAFADSSGTQHPQYYIQQTDKDVPVDQLAGPGIHVRKLGESKGGWHLPSVADREQAFYQAGLRPDVSSWDQLDRDMLYLRARNTSLKALSSQYPKLAKYKLQKLHRLLVKGQKTRGAR